MALAFANGLDNNSSVSFDISDDESDCDKSYTASVYTLLVVPQRIKGTNMVQEPPRRIAGTRRVFNYRKKNGLTHVPIHGTSAQLLQSITAIPALSNKSFEEIRLECYSQSVVATGRPPQAVNPSLNPSAVIPPLFMPVQDDNTGESTITMYGNDMAGSPLLRSVSVRWDSVVDSEP